MSCFCLGWKSQSKNEELHDGTKSRTATNRPPLQNGSVQGAAADKMVRCLGGGCAQYGRGGLSPWPAGALHQDGGRCARKPGLAKGHLWVLRDGQPTVLRLGGQEPSEKCPLLVQLPDVHICPSVSPCSPGAKLGVGFLTEGKGATDLPLITPAEVPSTANAAWVSGWGQWELGGGLEQKAED